MYKVDSSENYWLSVGEHIHIVWLSHANSKKMKKKSTENSKHPFSSLGTVSLVNLGVM